MIERLAKASRDANRARQPRLSHFFLDMFENCCPLSLSSADAFVIGQRVGVVRSPLSGCAFHSISLATAETKNVRTTTIHIPLLGLLFRAMVTAPAVHNRNICNISLYEGISCTIFTDAPSAKCVGAQGRTTHNCAVAVMVQDRLLCYLADRFNPPSRNRGWISIAVRSTIAT
jgi:hypothetical protein